METTPIKSKNKMSISKKSARKFLFSLVLFIVAVATGIYVISWYRVGRFHQETDNAYVAGNQIQIMPQVAGTVLQVNVDNTDFVHAGAILVILDPTDAEQALTRAKTNLASEVRLIHQQMIKSKEFQANVEVKKIELKRAQQDLQRRQSLSLTNAIGREELQHVQDAVISAEASLEIALQQLHANQALLLDTPLAQQPTVLKAAVALKDAWLALQRTKITSPVSGYVSRRSVQVGAQITTNSPLMAVVPADQLWIDANFKETQLENMRIGQPAIITSDLYGEKVVFEGKVVGMDMGTGSAFSLLPAQNATGNWIKIVQRLPVRIALDAKQLQKYPLRIGLSTKVTVDTKILSGEVLSVEPRQKPAYQTDSAELVFTPVNQMIDEIIRANAG